MTSTARCRLLESAPVITLRRPRVLVPGQRADQDGIDPAMQEVRDEAPAEVVGRERLKARSACKRAHCHRRLPLVDTMPTSALEEMAWEATGLSDNQCT